MTKSYSALFFWLGLTIAASVMLYHTSDRVHALDQELRTVNSQIESEQQSIHVLKAEWVYLANPARIEAAVHRHLSLAPTAPRHVVALQDISTVLPVHAADVAVAQIKPVVDKPNVPVQVAEAAVAPAAMASARDDLANISPAQAKHGRLVTALNGGHINDHMNMQHTASAQQASVDGIGGLISSLGIRP